MADAKHTPGPWRLSPESERAEWIADADAAHAIDADDPVDGRLFEVAAVWGIDRSDREDDRSLANARLIAAAPELLEAAQAAWNCIGELSPTQARVETAQLLQAAIAKATGGDS